MWVARVRMSTMGSSASATRGWVGPYLLLAVLWGCSFLFIATALKSFTPTQVAPANPSRPPSVAVRRPAPAPVEQAGTDRGVAWPPLREVRPDDTQPISIPPRRPAGDDDGPGWAVSGERGTFVPVQEPDRYDD